MEMNQLNEEGRKWNKEEERKSIEVEIDTQTMKCKASSDIKLRRIRDGKHSIEQSSGAIPDLPLKSHK